MLDDQFVKAIPVLDTLEKAGYEAYFVGGCVRDFLLQGPIKDVDIATSALPEEVQSVFEKVIPTGLKHGTVTVLFGDDSYEVTTYRIEKNYSDQRRPDEVEFIRNIEEDLKRRDFTMNAFAMDQDGKMIDLFSGKDDMASKVIRTVGNATERFKEDPLRMMRAIRFVSQLGFTIEEKTFTEILLLRGEIESIAVERIREEMEQFFKGEYIQDGWEILLKTRLHEHLPIFKNNLEFVKNIPKLTSFKNFAEVLAMMHYIDEKISIEEWIREWKCSKRTKNDSKNIFQALIDFKKNKLNAYLVYKLYEVNFKALIHLVHLLKIDQSLTYDDLMNEYEQLPIKFRQEMKVDGSDILSIYPNYKRGRWIQNLLLQLEKKVVLGEISNNKTELKEWILCHPPEVN